MNFSNYLLVRHFELIFMLELFAELLVRFIGSRIGEMLARCWRDVVGVNYWFAKK